jgi:hypothetical protein
MDLEKECLQQQEGTLSSVVEQREEQNYQHN